jgi:hypothetical protein
VPRQCSSNASSARLTPPLCSLATTPGNTVASSFSTATEWEPDTPTLKAWARHELRTNGGEGGSDLFDRMQQGRPASSNSLSSSEEEENEEEGGDEADDENTDGFDDYRGLDYDFSSLNIARLAYKSKGNGVICEDSDGDDEDYDYDDDEYVDDDDVVDTRVERYFHVADDSEDDDDEDVEDELFDDSS